MRASYAFSLLAVVAATSLACGSSSSPAADGGGGAGGDAPVTTGGTGGGGTGGTGGGGGGGGTGGMGGTGGSIFDCNTGTATDPCSRAERTTLNQCYTSRCQTAYNTCYGPNARMGTFDGPCRAFIQCISNCGCGNVQCNLGCVPMYTNECMACQATIQTCQDTSNCVVPACAVRPDGGITIPDGGFGGLFDGGFTIPDGGFGGLFDGGGGTCANLMSCCAAITDPPTRTQCMQEYAVSQPYGDAVCGVLYQGHKAAGDCP